MKKNKKVITGTEQKPIDKSGQIEGTSFNHLEIQLQKLREAFPEVISEQGIDWEKLRLTLGDDIALTNERYVLNWAGKTDAFRAIQTPTTATLKPQREHSIDFDTTQNIFVEGENLEVLKVLQKSYYNKVKMIYIDPPYNTGNDSFIYPDKFSESKEEYLKRIGDKDEAGYLTKEGFFRKNSKENGQYHSNWLSMMYPRLFLARNLLQDDGVIFVSIDDNEVHNLRLIMNEIFGEENFVAQLIWKSRQFPDSRAVTNVSTDHEYIVVYAKHSDFRFRGVDRDESKFKNPDKDPRGLWMSRSILGLATSRDRPNLHYEIIDPATRIKYSPPPDTGWRYSKEKMQSLINDGRILFPPKPIGRPREKKFREDLKDQFISFPTFIEGIYTAQGTTEIRELFGSEYFEFPKPPKLIKALASQVIEDDDIMIDFFAGSGTTAQAVLELNKDDSSDLKFILVQLPEKTEEDSEAHKAGYKTIADICKERIRRVIKRMSEPLMDADKMMKDDKKGIQEELSLRGIPTCRETEAIRLTADNQIASPDLRRDRNDTPLGFKVFTLEPSNFKIWRTDTIETVEELKKQMEAFVDPVRVHSNADDMAWEILLKSGYELTTPMERIDITGISVYSIAEGELMLILEEVKQDAIDTIIARKPKRVICLDRLFAGNDQLKTNTVLQMKDAGIAFATI
jgi:adenine-specific DNA-methyltransferase